MHSRTLRYYLNLWPGERHFGIYRFLPIFFVLGAALEFSMINWRVGETNFCNFCVSFSRFSYVLHVFNIFSLDTTYKKRRAQEIAREKLGLDQWLEQRMPAGVGWPQYLKFCSAAMVTMFAGSQCVHLIYRPLDDMDVQVKKEIERLKNEVSRK